jgi:hypothetical protein
MNRTASSTRMVALALALAAGLAAVVPVWAKFHRPVTLSRPGQDANYPTIAMHSTGRALVLWSRFDGAKWRLQGRQRSPEGVYTPLRTLSQPGGDVRWFADAAINGNGDALIVWHRFDGANYRVQARTWSAAGVLGLVQTLSGSGIDSRVPMVAFDSAGNALVVWSERPGDQIRARSVSAQRQCCGGVGEI